MTTCLRSCDMVTRQIHEAHQCLHSLHVGIFGV